MLKRKIYLNKITPYIGTDLIKVLIGVRRSGKSYLLIQIINYLKEDKNVSSENIIYINFESLEFEDIANYKLLHKYIHSKILNEKKYYIFIDEIQMVDSWEKTVNSLRVDANCELFITGSNSKLLSSELSSLLAGRYIDFKIFPFNFYEIKKYYELEGINKTNEEIFNEYLEYGGIPQVVKLPNKDEKLEYLGNLYSTIVLKDIVSRYNIVEYDLLQKIIDFAIDNISKTFSPRSVADFLRSNGRAIGNEKVYEYIRFCNESMFLNKVKRFDIKGKTLLATQEKHYLCDIGYRKLRLSKDLELGKVYENIVFLELLIRGYKVSVGKFKEYEVDFVAEKGTDRVYIQVSFGLNNEDTINREFRPLELINDNYKKVLITNEIYDFSKNGIKHLNIIEFLDNLDIL